MSEIIHVPTEEIRFLIRRTRDPAEFAGVKGAIQEAGGIVQPLQGIDIRSWKPQDRRRPDAGLYNYLAGFGEGRTTAAQELAVENPKDPRWRSVPFIVLNISEGELLLRHITENTRVDIPWVDRAELLRASINARMSVEELKQKHHLSAKHIGKLLRVLDKTSPKVLEAVRQLTVQEAETLVQLPPAEQEIVVGALHETGLHGSQTPAVVRMAQEQVFQTGKLSKTVLVRDIARLKQTVTEQRKVLKLKRTHVAIGPQIYGEHLLHDRKLLQMLKERGIDWKPFMEAYRK